MTCIRTISAIATIIATFLLGGCDEPLKVVNITNNLGKPIRVDVNYIEVGNKVLPGQSVAGRLRIHLRPKNTIEVFDASTQKVILSSTFDKSNRTSRWYNGETINVVVVQADIKK